MTHGGDFTFPGWEEELEDAADYLKRFYELKVGGIVGGVEGIIILNRRLTWRGDEMKYEADLKRAEMVCRGLGLEMG